MAAAAPSPPASAARWPRRKSWPKPPQLPAPPSFQKVNPADSPILFIALLSNTQPLYKVDDYAEQVFAEQISQIAGVSQVLVFGQQKFAVRVAVDPDAAAARGLTLENVGAAVAAANSSTALATATWPRSANARVISA